MMMPMIHGPNRALATISDTRPPTATAPPESVPVESIGRIETTG